MLRGGCSGRKSAAVCLRLLGGWEGVEWCACAECVCGLRCSSGDKERTSKVDSNARSNKGYDPDSRQHPLPGRPRLCLHVPAAAGLILFLGPLAAPLGRRAAAAAAAAAAGAAALAGGGGGGRLRLEGGGRLIVAAEDDGVELGVGWAWRGAAVGVGWIRLVCFGWFWSDGFGVVGWCVLCFYLRVGQRGADPIRPSTATHRPTHPL